MNPSSKTENVQTIEILNIDTEESTISLKQIINTKTNNKSYILSDVDEELIILIKFKQITNVKSLKLYALPIDETDIDASAPKQVHIYKIDNLSKSFDDIKSMKPNKSIKLKPKKLINGQQINLNKNPKNSIKFKQIKYLAIYIESNQNHTEKTYIHGIEFNAESTSPHPPNQSTQTKKSDALSSVDTKIMNNLSETLASIMKDNEDHPETRVHSAYLIQQHSVCDAQNKSECDLLTCIPLQRLTDILSKYHHFIRENKCVRNEEKQNIASYQHYVYGNNQMQQRLHNGINKIRNDKYDNTQIMNDFHHVLSVHKNEFEDIYNVLREKTIHDECTVSQCFMIQRNHRDRNILDKTDISLRNTYYNCSDTNDVIIQQTLDTVHCHFFHSLDAGYKLSRREKSNIQQMMHNTDFKHNALDDTLYHDEIASKIFKLIQNKSAPSTTTKFCATLDDTETKYSFGVKYFYWQYYYHNSNVVDPATIGGIFESEGLQNKSIPVNEYDEHIYRLGDFFVSLKYKELKEELMNNSISTIASLQWNILNHKALCALQTTHIKSCCYMHKESDNNYYEIAGGTPITLAHIVAIMAYCNETQLQCKFSETYRRIPKNEHIASLIERHRNFANMGKLLRECVDCFGAQYTDDAIHAPQNNHSTILYHGMNIQSQFSSMHANIKGPFSTTTEYTIAVKFCANVGMVLELCLDAQWDFPKHCDSTSLFECEYISDFPYEKEIFFIGGFSNFIFSAIIAPNGNNYHLYIRALNRLMQHLNSFHIFANVFTPFDPYEFAVNRTHCHHTEEELDDTLELIAYRMLSDELHRHYPEDKEYHILQSMPTYARGLLQRHFEGVRQLNPDKKRNNSIGSLLYDDFGWLKLDIITTIFPKVQYIKLTDYVANSELIENDLTFISVLSLIETKPNMALNRIVLKVFGARQEMEERVSPFRDAFASLNWSIFRECGPYVHIVWNGMKRMYKPENQKLFSNYQPFISF